MLAGFGEYIGRNKPLWVVSLGGHHGSLGFAEVIASGPKMIIKLTTSTMLLPEALGLALGSCKEHATRLLSPCDSHPLWTRVSLTPRQSPRRQGTPSPARPSNS